MLFPFFRAVALFGVGAWVFDKVVAGVTGRTLDQNLDAGSEKVLSFVRPKGESTPPTDAGTLE